MKSVSLGIIYDTRAFGKTLDRTVLSFPRFRFFSPNQAIIFPTFDLSILDVPLIPSESRRLVVDGHFQREKS